MAKASRGGRAGPANGEMAAGRKAAGDAGSTTATGLQDIAQAWDDYARHVMERTAEATQALLKCRTFNDMLGVQAELMRGHLQAFLDQSTKLAEISNRMAARSLEEIRNAGGEASTDKNR
jgi:hypothetical protein